MCENMCKNDKEDEDDDKDDNQVGGCDVWSSMAFCGFDGLLRVERGLTLSMQEPRCSS